MAVEIINGADDPGPSPPQEVTTNHLEIAALSIPRLFGDECDLLQLHEYQKVSVLRLRLCI